MTVFYWLMEAVTCVIDGLLYIYTYQIFLKGKWKCGWKEIRYMIVIALMGIISFAFPDWGNIFSTLGIYIILLIYGKSCKDENNKKVILHITILYLSIGIFIVLFMNLFHVITKIPISEMTECASGNARLYALIILKITCFFGVTVIIHSDKNKKERLHTTEKNQLLFEYISMMVIMVIIMYLMENENLKPLSQILLNIVCLGIFCVFVETCILFQRLNAMHRERTEYKAITYMEQIEQKNVKERKYEYERMQMLNHDMKHYLSTAIGMIGKEDSAGVKDYLETILREKITLNPVGVCIGNSVLEAVINTKAAVMKDKGIVLEAFLADDINYGNAINLSIMLSNLLDNAIEACLNCEEKKRLIRIQSRKQKGYIHFQIQNTIADDVIKKNPMLKTTKNDKELHGLGIRSVRSMLEEEHGFMNQYQNKMFFISDLYIPVVPKNDQLCQRG